MRLPVTVLILVVVLRLVEGRAAPDGRRLSIVRHVANHTEHVPGKLLRLECCVSFEPVPEGTPSADAKAREDALKKIKIRWLKNEVPIDRINVSKTISNGAVTSVLRLKNLDVHDKGYYSCIASYQKQQVKSEGLVDIVDYDTDYQQPIVGLSPTLNVTMSSKISDSFPTSEIEHVFTKNVPRMASTSFPFVTDVDEQPHENLTAHAGLCQIYAGGACNLYLRNQSVYVPYPITQSALEKKLTGAFKVISLSNELSNDCEKFALPSLCFSTFPVCKTPEATNEKFFRYLEHREDSETNAIHKISREDNDDQDKITIMFENLPSSGLPPHLDPNVPTTQTRRLSHTDFIKFIPDLNSRENSIKKRTGRETDIIPDSPIIDFSPEQMSSRFGRRTQADIDKFSISRSSVPLRRVCRDDCEILENEVCQKEYAIAKRHPEIGQKLTLEECIDLPENSSDCLEIGIDRPMTSDQKCYWETGQDYRGDASFSSSGLPCIKWSDQFKVKVSDFPELFGARNHCRNPGGTEPQPWCFVERGAKVEKMFCNIPKCSRELWIFIIGGIGTTLAILLLCISICCRCQSSKHNTAAIRNINLPNADKNIYGNSRLNSPIELADLLNGQNIPSDGSGSRTNRILRVPQYSLSQIKFVRELGEGAFGKVYKGELTRDGDTVFVAVKALKENASPKTQLDFKREIELISELHHENIVCILGVVLREEPLCMLFEFMAMGDLHEFLVSRAPPGGVGLTPPQFLSISHHIAAGMEYLAAHHYVHRDLAARNCLVAENLVVKISDFGLSRDIYSSDYYRVQSKSLLPVRWMPPESILYGKFTTESDVWSYGVVLWEIYSYGLQPYYGYSNQEVIAMVRGRELLKCPADCPRALYNLMRECWHQIPARRPNFTIISNRLNEWRNSNIRLHADNTSESSGALSSQRAPNSVGDPRERVPLISHHSSSNGSLAGSMPRKLSAAGSIRSHASTRLMVSSSDVTSGSDNFEAGNRAKKSSCGSLLDEQASSAQGERQRDVVVKLSSMTQPYAF